VIKPGLRRQSLRNGNIRGCGQRLSPIGALRLPIWESGDEVECAKSRHFRPILASPGERGRTPDWLAGAGGFEPPNGEMSAILPSGRFGAISTDVATSDRDVRLNQRLS
jgi:hypothetical protein